MIKLTLVAFLALFVGQISAASGGNVSFSMDGRTIKFVDLNSGIQFSFMDELSHLFFDVYPKMTKAYNQQASKQITLIFDPKYDGVCATWGDVITCQPQWFKDHPKDIDAVTHELFHCVQFKKTQTGWAIDNARWLIEGMADHARNQFGKQNDAANWRLSTYTSGQQYTDGYTVTGGFLKYIEGKWNGTVKKLFDAQYALNYNDNLFKTLTGKSLQDLWTDYSKIGSSGRKKRNINDVNPKFAKIQSE